MTYKNLLMHAWAHLRGSRTIWFFALIGVAIPILISISRNPSLNFLLLFVQYYALIICSAGIIWTVYMREEHKNPTLTEAHRAVRPYFWRLVGLGFLTFIASMLIVFPICICSTLGAVKEAGTNGTMFLQFLIVGLVYAFLSVLPTCFLLLKGCKVWQSIEKGFGMIGKNFVPYLMLSLLTFGAQLAVMALSWGFATLVNGSLAPEGASLYLVYAIQSNTLTYKIFISIFNLVLTPLISIVFTLTFLEYLKPAAWREWQAMKKGSR